MYNSTSGQQVLFGNTSTTSRYYIQKIFVIPSNLVASSTLTQY